MIILWNGTLQWIFLALSRPLHWAVPRCHLTVTGRLPPWVLVHCLARLDPSSLETEELWVVCYYQCLLIWKLQQGNPHLSVAPLHTTDRHVVWTNTPLIHNKEMNPNLLISKCEITILPARQTPVLFHLLVYVRHSCLSNNSHLWLGKLHWAHVDMTNFTLELIDSPSYT